MSLQSQPASQARYVGDYIGTQAGKAEITHVQLALCYNKDLIYFKTLSEILILNKFNGVMQFMLLCRCEAFLWHSVLKGCLEVEQ